MVERVKYIKGDPKKRMIKNHDPHSTLGIQPFKRDFQIIRVWRPGAEKVHLEVFGKVVEAEKVDEQGFFEYLALSRTRNLDYRIYHSNGLLAHDPYAFSPTFGEMDAHLFAKGTHYGLYNALGAHCCTHEGVEGVRFAVWAPSARRVSIVGDFNNWDGRVNPMRGMGSSGVWELFIPGLKEGEKYKFEIQTPDSFLRVKADPYANYSELRPKNASIVFDLDQYDWKDQKWMEERTERHRPNRPMNIYEVHLGSWKKKEGGFVGYRELAHQLAEYCKDMSFTHVELLPIAEHPLDDSWGYQVTGFFAPTSRFGSPRDFQYFVDHLHSQGIGVILDWVPAHFPMDDFALARFDGTYLYEHSDPKQSVHPHWNTYIFNYSRYEVSNFLIASALFWLDKMHIDGLRVDAVASMLYLDYGRKEGEWIPNRYGGNENLDAIEFLKHFNSIVHERFPGAVTFAEESSSFTGVTKPLAEGGLGFDLKWNMGWMNDTLRYFQKDPLFRSHHHNDLTFGLLYAFSERFISVLSHDEVVHGKKSLLGKMPGDEWQKFANLRLLQSYMICQPGKKLLFMGGEIAQWDEWGFAEELHWFLLRFPIHSGMQNFFREINRFYLQSPALWKNDHTHEGFDWVDFSDESQSVISYLRKSEEQTLLVIHNFTPAFHEQYNLPLKGAKEVKEVFTSDREEYGGSGKVGLPVKLEKEKAVFSISPLATMIFEVTFDA